MNAVYYLRYENIHYRNADIYGCRERRAALSLPQADSRGRSARANRVGLSRHCSRLMRVDRLGLGGAESLSSL